MKHQILRLGGALAIGWALIAFAPPAPALAEEQTCRGTIGGQTVDNLRVPDGATCTLQGTRVQGTIKVERGAVLKAFGVRVIGKVQGEDARKVVLARSSRVGGSVQIVQSGAAVVRDSRIKGDILFDDNGQHAAALRNVVGGSIQVFQNTGGVRIFDNRVDGNLQCKEKAPSPVGARNVVQGNKEDQCRGF